MIKRQKRQPAILLDELPKFWACECGQMNPRDHDYCCTCGGDREENWEGKDRETVLAEEQWDID